MLIFLTIVRDRSAGSWAATNHSMWFPALVSSSITWETVTQWDLGLDFNFLNSRLKGAFDYYQDVRPIFLPQVKFYRAFWVRTNLRKMQPSH